MEKKRGRLGQKILICVLALVFLFALYKIVSIGLDYQKIDNFYEETQEVFTPRDILNDKWGVSLPEVDFDSLTGINDDIIAWIYIPDTNVSFPVLKGKDNQQYLYQSYEKEYLTAGSIFIDYRCRRSFSDRHTVIYGHNMHNGSMFGSLKKYEDESYKDEHPYVYILRANGDVNRYQIFAYYQAAVDGPVFEFPLQKDCSDEEFERLATTIFESNQYEPVTSGTGLAGEKYITLTTCTQDSRNDVRVCISARLCDGGKL